MFRRVYATASDYESFAEEPFEGTPAKLGKRLRAASVEVDGLTRYARYDVDEDGNPTAQDVADAFTEATCAIVEHWEITDDPTGAEAAAGAIKIGSVSLGTTSSREEGGDTTERRIGSRALSILSAAGLSSRVSY